MAPPSPLCPDLSGHSAHALHRKRNFPLESKPPQPGGAGDTLEPVPGPGNAACWNVSKCLYLGCACCASWSRVVGSNPVSTLSPGQFLTSESCFSEL